jgi:hypothetical protein
LDGPTLEVLVNWCSLCLRALSQALLQWAGQFLVRTKNAIYSAAALEQQIGLYRDRQSRFLHGADQASDYGISVTGREILLAEGTRIWNLGVGSSGGELSCGFAVNMGTFAGTAECFDYWVIRLMMRWPIVLALLTPASANACGRSSHLQPLCSSISGELRIIPALTTELFVVNLQIRSRTTVLASPPIAAEHLLTKLFVQLGIKPLVELFG